MRKNIYINFYSAWLRVSIEYRNLKIGYLWESISLIFVVLFLTFVWGKVLDATSLVNYFFYVLTGFSVWNLMSKCIDQSLSFKHRAIADLRRGGSNLQNQIFTDIIYTYIQFLLSFPFVFLVCILHFGFSVQHGFYLFLSLLCIFVCGYALFALLGFLAVFFEDVSKLIRMVMRVAFLMTPILWVPSMLGEENLNYIYLNPFYSYLDVFRSSLMHEEVSGKSTLMMVSVTLVLSLIALRTYKFSESLVLREIYLQNNDR